MSLLSVLSIPDPVLKQVAQPIENITAEHVKLLKNMVETMYDDRGIGLAANQIGNLERLIVMDVPEGCWQYEDKNAETLQIIPGKSRDESRKPLMMINPEITWESEQQSRYEEGCLSVPGHYADVVRPASVRLKYIDENGQEQEMEADGLPSHCIQHEIDHLNGIVFIDHISALKRNMIIKKIKKEQKHIL